MGKVETYTKNRVEGLIWALNLICKAKTLEEGVENLRREVKFRRETFVPLEFSKEQIRGCNTMMAERILNTVQVVCLKMMEEEYGWGKIRLQRFVRLFYENTKDMQSYDPYGDRYVNISEYAEYFKDTYGISFEDEAVETMKQIEAENRSLEVKRVQIDVLEKLLENRYPDALEYLRKELKFKK